MAMSEKPDVTYADIGGMDIQKQEIKVGLGRLGSFFGGPF